MFWRKNRHRAVSAALLSLFIVSSIAPAVAKSSAAHVAPDTSRAKGLLDNVIRVITGQKKICLIGNLCIDGGQLTETLLADQIRDFSKKNAPVTGSSDNLFPVARALPGGQFDPALLDLRNAAPDEVILPGDYLIPVKFYCLQKPAASPPGHRYLLGQYDGKRKKVLSALGRASATSDASYQELQDLSWAIQSGVAYNDMPKGMQDLVNQLIPEHRSALKEDWWKQVEKIWNTGSSHLKLPSFRTFLTNNLGDVGSTLLAYQEVRERLVNRGQDWRNLSDIFILNDGTPGRGDILNTPWSQLGENVYARFITEGKAGDTGFLLLRLGEAEPGRTKALPLLPIVIKGAGYALTVASLHDIVSTLMALPEGKQNIQHGKLVLDLAGMVVGATLIGKAAKILRIEKVISVLRPIRKKRGGSGIASGGSKKPPLNGHKLNNEKDALEKISQGIGKSDLESSLKSSGWTSKAAVGGSKSGTGQIWTSPDGKFSIRVMTRSDGSSYARVYNGPGGGAPGEQPLNLSGKPGNRADTHFEIAP